MREETKQVGRLGAGQPSESLYVRLNKPHVERARADKAEAKAAQLAQESRQYLKKFAGDQPIEQCDPQQLIKKAKQGFIDRTENVISAINIVNAYEKYEGLQRYLNTGEQSSFLKTLCHFIDNQYKSIAKRSLKLAKSPEVQGQLHTKSSSKLHQSLRKVFKEYDKSNLPLNAQSPGGQERFIVVLKTEVTSFAAQAHSFLWKKGVQVEFNETGISAEGDQIKDIILKKALSKTERVDCLILLQMLALAKAAGGELAREGRVPKKVVKELMDLFEMLSSYTRIEFSSVTFSMFALANYSDEYFSHLLHEAIQKSNQIITKFFEAKQFAKVSNITPRSRFLRERECMKKMATIVSQHVDKTFGIKSQEMSLEELNSTFLDQFKAKKTSEVLLLKVLVYCKKFEDGSYYFSAAAFKQLYWILSSLGLNNRELGKRLMKDKTLGPFIAKIMQEKGKPLSKIDLKEINTIFFKAEQKKILKRLFDLTPKQDEDRLMRYVTSFEKWDGEVKRIWTKRIFSKKSPLNLNSKVYLLAVCFSQAALSDERARSLMAIHTNFAQKLVLTAGEGGDIVSADELLPALDKALLSGISQDDDLSNLSTINPLLERLFSNMHEAGVVGEVMSIVASVEQILISAESPSTSPSANQAGALPLQEPKVNRSRVRASRDGSDWFPSSSEEEKLSPRSTGKVGGESRFPQLSKRPEKPNVQYSAMDGQSTLSAVRKQPMRPKEGRQGRPRPGRVGLFVDPELHSSARKHVDRLPAAGGRKLRVGLNPHRGEATVLQPQSREAAVSDKLTRRYHGVIPAKREKKDGKFSGIDLPPIAPRPKG